MTKLLLGALCEWMRDTTKQLNLRLGPWLCPRRYPMR